MATRQSDAPAALSVLAVGGIAVAVAVMSVQLLGPQSPLSDMLDATATSNPAPTLMLVALVGAPVCFLVGVVVTLALTRRGR